MMLRAERVRTTRLPARHRTTQGTGDSGPDDRRTDDPRVSRGALVFGPVLMALMLAVQPARRATVIQHDRPVRRLRHPGRPVQPSRRQLRLQDPGEQRPFPAQGHERSWADSLCPGHRQRHPAPVGGLEVQDPGRHQLRPGLRHEVHEHGRQAPGDRPDPGGIRSTDLDSPVDPQEGNYRVHIGRSSGTSLAPRPRSRASRWPTSTTTRSPAAAPIPSDRTTATTRTPEPVPGDRRPDGRDRPRTTRPALADRVVSRARGSDPTTILAPRPALPPPAPPGSPPPS